MGCRGSSHYKTTVYQNFHRQKQAVNTRINTEYRGQLKYLFKREVCENCINHFKVVHFTFIFFHFNFLSFFFFSVTTRVSVVMSSGSPKHVHLIVSNSKGEVSKMEKTGVAELKT